MAWGSSDLNAVYNFPVGLVYTAVVYAAQSLKYNIRVADPNAHTITINFPMSLFSYGETMNISLYEIEGDTTSVIFSSKSALGTELGAKSKNKKNIEKLINAIPAYLPQH